MPTYCYRCPKCEAETETVKPMASVDTPEFCPVDGEQMARNYAAEQINSQAFNAYEACSGGAAAWEMETAFKRGKDWFRRRPDGSEYQLNPPGFKLHPKTGDVLIPGRKSEKRRYMREMGYVEVR